jgi:MraZ protein
MGFFKGQEIRSLDEKGRVAIPLKMRKALDPEAENSFTVTHGLEECIYAYPKNEWQVYEEIYKKKNQFVEKNRFFLRTLLEWSEDVVMDVQGRIPLSKELLAIAKIDGKVKVLGNVDHIEFWNPEVYENYKNSHVETYEEVAATVMPDLEK